MSSEICMVDAQELMLPLQMISRVSTLEHLRHWVAGPFRALVPHAGFVCGFVRESAGGKSFETLVAEHLPGPCVKELCGDNGNALHLLCERWAQRIDSPLFIDAFEGKGESDSALSSLFRKYGIPNVLVHGSRGANEAAGSYFILARLPASLKGRHVYFLKMLGPFMHAALVKASSHRTSAHPLTLTPKEEQVMRWLSIGKSNPEIACILEVSDETVKTHMKNIMVKLQVSNRTQAVARAMALGIIAP